MVRQNRLAVLTKEHTMRKPITMDTALALIGEVRTYKIGNFTIRVYLKDVKSTYGRTPSLAD